MKLFKAATLFLGFLICTGYSSGQTIGTIFDKDYADEEFGAVQSSVPISNTDLSNLLNLAGDYIMFNISTGSIRALDINRDPVQGSAASENEVFYLMSTSRIEELMNFGNSSITTIEMRPNTLTLTNGNFTLEFVWPCPPQCG